MLTIVIASVLGIGLGVLMTLRFRDGCAAIGVVFLCWFVLTLIGVYTAKMIGANQPMTDWVVRQHSILLPLEGEPGVYLAPKAGLISGYRYVGQDSPGNVTHGELLNTIEKFSILEDQPKGSAYIEYREKKVARISRWGIYQMLYREAVTEVHIPKGGLSRKPTS